jgi:thiol-disulfide isomerase/thioredoxin
MHWIAVDGTEIDLDEFQGRVVLIYFFASWSRPSMAELDWVAQLARHYDGVVPLGICLDNDPAGVPALMADHGIAWRVYCDGMGWRGKLVRMLGINALPALWIVDRHGVLISLNAKQDAQQLIENSVSDSTQ